jgi:hypothetical protein
MAHNNGSSGKLSVREGIAVAAAVVAVQAAAVAFYTLLQRRRSGGSGAGAATVGAAPPKKDDAELAVCVHVDAMCGGGLRRVRCRGMPYWPCPRRLWGRCRCAVLSSSSAGAWFRGGLPRSPLAAWLRHRMRAAPDLHYLLSRLQRVRASLADAERRLAAAKSEAAALRAAAAGANGGAAGAPAARKPVRVYLDGCFDMMHYGHSYVRLVATELTHCVLWRRSRGHSGTSG